MHSAAATQLASRTTGSVPVFAGQRCSLPAAAFQVLGSASLRPPPAPHYASVLHAGPNRKKRHQIISVKGECINLAIVCSSTPKETVLNSHRRDIKQIPAQFIDFLESFIFLLMASFSYLRIEGDVCCTD